MVVDDEPIFANAAAKVLGRTGYEVHTALALAPALELLNSWSFDAIITDLSLTGTRGLEGLEIAERAKALNPNARVILVTAYGSDEVTRRASECGVDLMLEKPVSLALLRQILANFGLAPDGVA